ncbi:MAG: methyl-accepting chemotaxis protein [Candidatus Heimdallarchaeota archaeon]|nr:methyl-accepting chemotaxis protein [Candidatus Heimdallarchaeota archaeon]
MSKGRDSSLRRRFNNIFDLSVRSKILLPFFIIIGLFGVQFYVSTQAVDQIDKNFANLENNNNLNAILTRMNTEYQNALQQIQFHAQNLVEPSIIKSAFDELVLALDEDLNEVQELYEKVVFIEKFDETNSLLRIFDLRRDQPKLRNFGESILNSIPVPIVTQITSETLAIRTLMIESKLNLLKYSTTFEPVFGTAALNQSAEIPNQVQRSLEAIDLIEDINHTLFTQFKNEIDSIYSFSGGELGLNEFQSLIAQIHTHVTENLGIVSEEVNTILQELVTDLTALSGPIEVSILGILDSIQTQTDVIEAEVQEMAELINNEFEFVGIIIFHSNNNVQNIEKSIGAATQNLENIQTITVILVISVTLIVGFLVTREIAIPINDISDWSEKISQGDLTVKRLKTEFIRSDEVGSLYKNFKSMNHNLREIIIGMKDSNDLIIDTAQNLASNTEEINATSMEVASIAQSMAKGSTHQAELISDVVQQLSQTSLIVDTVISQINDNLAVIKDLTEQINILAINSAIEAANVGEFGKGFVVISDNIRKMAVSSKKSSDYITRDSQVILQQLQTTFTDITEKMENVASVSEETAASAEEVAASAEEMTAIMQNVSAKSTELNDQSITTAKLVNRFKLE